MAFKNYTDIAQVMEEFKIRYQESDFIQPRDFQISQVFLDYGLLKDIKEAEQQIDEGKAIPHKTALKRAQKKINAKVVKSSGKK